MPRKATKALVPLNGNHLTVTQFRCFFETYIASAAAFSSFFTSCSDLELTTPILAVTVIDPPGRPSSSAARMRSPVAPASCAVKFGKTTTNPSPPCRYRLPFLRIALRFRESLMHSCSWRWRSHFARPNPIVIDFFSQNRLEFETASRTHLTSVVRTFKNGRRATGKGGMR